MSVELSTTMKLYTLSECEKYFESITHTRWSRNITSTTLSPSSISTVTAAASVAAATSGGGAGGTTSERQLKTVPARAQAAPLLAAAIADSPQVQRPRVLGTVPSSSLATAGGSSSLASASSNQSSSTNRDEIVRPENPEEGMVKEEEGDGTENPTDGISLTQAKELSSIVPFVHDLFKHSTYLFSFLFGLACQELEKMIKVAIFESRFTPQAAHQQNSESVTASTVIKFISDLINNFQSNFVFPYVARQFLERLFAWMDCILFNEIMHSKNLCTAVKGAEVKVNLRIIENFMLDEGAIWLGTLNAQLFTKMYEVINILLIQDKGGLLNREVREQVCPTLEISQINQILQFYTPEKTEKKHSWFGKSTPAPPKLIPLPSASSSSSLSSSSSPSTSALAVGHHHHHVLTSSSGSLSPHSKDHNNNSSIYLQFANVILAQPIQLSKFSSQVEDVMKLTLPTQYQKELLSAWFSWSSDILHKGKIDYNSKEWSYVVIGLEAACQQLEKVLPLFGNRTPPTP